MKDESVAMLIESFSKDHSYFILHPSSFILALRSY
jgi:hypothetical protein